MARLPVMVGFNLPGFKFFDLIAIQAEYQKSPWLNNTYQRGTANINLPFLPNSTDEVMSEADYSILSTRTISNGPFCCGKASTGT